MKKLLIILILLSSCSTPEQLASTSQIVKGDKITIKTTKFVSLTRQERLAIKDSLKHELKLAKVERLVIRDSIKYVYKTKWIEKVRFKDSIRYVYKEIKQDNKH